MQFYSRPYQTFPSQTGSRISGELTLSHVCNYIHGSPAAYIRNCGVSDAAYHLVYDGQGMSHRHTPKLIPLDGFSALMGH